MAEAYTKSLSERVTMEINTKVRIYFRDGFAHDYTQDMEFRAWVDTKVRWLAEYTIWASVESEDYCCRVESVGLGAFLVAMPTHVPRQWTEVILKDEKTTNVEFTL